MSLAPNHNVAQLNIGVLCHPIDDPRTAGFAQNTDAVNAVAERSAGFIWRLVDEEAALHDEGISLFDGNPNAICTLSLWSSAEDLESFVLRTIHGSFLKRRAEWFIEQDHKTYVIWPVAAGQRPTIREGLDRLADLEASGANEGAYDFNYLRQRLHRSDET